MATPRPMRAMRNSTMMLTEVTWVRPPTSRKVDGMATAAMSSGTTAMKMANTNARTTSDPMPPKQRLGQGADPLGGPAVLQLGDAGDPAVPPGRRRRGDRGCDDRGLGVVEAGRLGGVNTSPKLVWPSAVAKWASPVLDWSATRDPGIDRAAACRTRSAAAGVAVSPPGRSRPRRRAGRRRRSGTGR